jgi:sigma-E factor negative regulatory protein RseA
MTESHRENLSAAVDGELTKEELRFLLRRLDHDEALLGAWGRYHAARHGQRRELSVLASPGFAARVMSAIEAEAAVPAGMVRHRTGRRHWLRWSAGGAIAAGVAVAALMVSQPTGDNGVRRAAPAVASANAAPHPQQRLAEAAVQAPATPPASVPPWLSSNAWRFSERASMTLGEPTSDDPLRPYRVSRYRTLDNGDGSYLLLVDPARAASGRLPQAAAAQ